VPASPKPGAIGASAIETVTQAGVASPVYFGSEGRELFGMLHPGTGSSPGVQPMAVVLCNAFGLEGIRAHRTFRVLAERLARAGHFVLRFDYFGSGDSAGDDSDVTLAGLRQDIESADRMVQSVSIGLPRVWIGLGLGATAALLAARHSTKPPARLILWEPVVDGTAYLKALRQRHAQIVEEAFASRFTPKPPQAGHAEALGFAISARLEAEVAGLGVSSLHPLPQGIRTTLVARPGDMPAKLLADQATSAAGSFDYVEQSHDVDWMSETADAGTLVPGAAILKLAQLVRSA
jgi:hypothetical protein